MCVCTKLLGMLYHEKHSQPVSVPALGELLVLFLEPALHYPGSQLDPLCWSLSLDSLLCKMGLVPLHPFYCGSWEGCGDQSTFWGEVG